MMKINLRGALGFVFMGLTAALSSILPFKSITKVKPDPHREWTEERLRCRHG